MHSVIKHILERKHKKVPVDDGRKIVLVMFGGAMTAVRGGGAAVALHELGLNHAFDEIYAVSAGVASAAYLLTGDIMAGASFYFKHLPNKKFINFLRPKKIIDVKHAIKLMREGSDRLDVAKLKACQTDFFIGVRESMTGDIAYLRANDHYDHDFFNLIHASMSIPFLAPGKVVVKNKAYQDLGMGYHLDLVERILASEATDILLVYNYSFQRKKTFTESDRVYELLPDSGSVLNHFEKRIPVLRKEAQHMGDKVKQIFGSGKPINLNINL